MKQKTIHAALLVGVVCALQSVGGPTLAAEGPERMLEVLLRASGWRAEWSGPGGSGVTELVFERQSDKLVAKIRLLSPVEMACENPVTIADRSITFDGCRDPGVTLAFDPADPEMPFRGRTPRGYEWKLRAK